METQNRVRRLTVGRLTPAELSERLTQPGRDAAILAEIICAMYWGGTVPFNLQKLEALSEPNWHLAVEIMGYRRSPLWSEAQLHVIATWCRERFALTQWDHEE